MSGDMMQTLPGYSLLSLSFGTLPAVKAGMNLDANPFASQLALMTGPEAAIGTSAVPVAAAGAGEFALTLAGMADAPVAQGLSVPQLLGADPVLAKPIGAAVASPRIAPLPDANVLAALPPDASPSEIIEAVMSGSVAKPARAVEAQPVAVAALKDVSVDQAQPTARPAITTSIAPAPPAAVIADMQKLRPQPMAAANAAADVVAQPEGALAADSEQTTPEAAETRVRRPAKASNPEVAVADPAIIAPAITPVTPPLAAAPKEYAPDSGTTRVAVSAAPTPVAAPVGDDVSKPAASGRVPVDTTAPISMPAAPQSSPPSAPAVDAAAPAQFAQTTETRAGPAQLAASAPVMASPQPATGDVTPSADAPKAVAPRTAEAIAPAPAAVAPAAPAISASAAVSTPAATATPANVTGEAPAASTIPANIPANIPAAASVSPQPVRAVAPAVRAVAGTPSQRAVQAAVQSSQPAQALAALFNLGNGAAEPLAEPVPVEGMTEMPTAPKIEAVQPSWVAALNAVTSPTSSPAVQALTAPTAAAAPQASLETLAFDAAFIGNIETQISRVMGGAQMVRMQIMPEHLGRIDIEMLAGPDRDSVRLVTEHDAVRDTLVQSQVRLEQDLRQNGQRQAEVTVELRQQSAGTQGGSAQQQRGQGGAEGFTPRDTAQRQNAGAAADTQTPAQRRPRGNVRYA